MKTLSLTDTRNRLLKIVEQMERDPSTVVAVSKRGKPVMALLPMEVYEGLLETLEILGDEKAMHSIRKSIGQLKAGKTIPWEKARASLDLEGEA